MEFYKEIEFSTGSSAIVWLKLIDTSRSTPLLPMMHRMIFRAILSSIFIESWHWQRRIHEDDLIFTNLFRIVYLSNILVS